MLMTSRKRKWSKTGSLSLLLTLALDLGLLALALDLGLLGLALALGLLALALTLRP